MGEEATERVGRRFPRTPHARRGDVKSRHIFRHTKKGGIYEYVEIPAGYDGGEVVDGGERGGEDLSVTPWIAPHPDDHFEEACEAALRSA